ncbi:MAG: YifB family Mg chelatase-like AAA ATPase, partial [Pseudomonadota bacterium]
LNAMAIALPSKRITINLSPADMPKEGSHFDLPIALALLAALDIVPKDAVEGTCSLGELSLDGSLVPVSGALPAAMAAAEESRILLCPRASGSEAAWVGDTQVIGAATLTDVVRHFTGQAPLAPARPGEVVQTSAGRDLRDVKGQERAKRALEIAAAGRHHLIMIGPPGSGKSMLAKRMPGILPPLSAAEALETSMVHSLAGLIEQGGISRTRPFCEPHHTASKAALVGGGRRSGPGQVSLAHNGVLFMDEFPEFASSVLDSLRQPVETGEVVVSRANAHVRYPCRFLLVAAANPCKCGGSELCSRGPKCREDYLGRISGPLMDRFDLRIDVPSVSFSDLSLPATGDSTADVAQRVNAARLKQKQRFETVEGPSLNADAEGEVLAEIANPDPDGRDLLRRASERFNLSARGYHRVMRVARTIADLDDEDTVRRHHIAEALSYRQPSLQAA